MCILRRHFHGMFVHTPAGICWEHSCAFILKTIFLLKRVYAAQRQWGTKQMKAGWQSCPTVRWPKWLWYRLRETEIGFFRKLWIDQQKGLFKNKPEPFSSHEICNVISYKCTCRKTPLWIYFAKTDNSVFKNVKKHVFYVIMFILCYDFLSVFANKSFNCL